MISCLADATASRTLWGRSASSPRYTSYSQQSLRPCSVANQCEHRRRTLPSDQPDAWATGLLGVWQRGHRPHLVFLEDSAEASAWKLVPSSDGRSLSGRPSRMCCRFVSRDSALVGCAAGRRKGPDLCTDGLLRTVRGRWK